MALQLLRWLADPPSSIPACLHVWCPNSGFFETDSIYQPTCLHICMLNCQTVWQTAWAVSSTQLCHIKRSREMKIISACRELIILLYLWPNQVMCTACSNRVSKLWKHVSQFTVHSYSTILLLLLNYMASVAFLMRVCCRPPEFAHLTKV